MHEWVLENFIRYAKKKNIDLNSTVITIFGYSFKQDCADTRNTKVKNLILSMLDYGIKLNLWDPLISQKDHAELNYMGVTTFKEEPENVEVAMICVYHTEFKNYFKNFNGLVYDYKDLSVAK